MKKNTKAPKPTALTNSPVDYGTAAQAAFWMPLKIGLFVGLIMAALTYPIWNLRRFFSAPVQYLDLAILKTADVMLLVLLPVLTGVLLGYLLYRNNASVRQVLVAVALCGFLQQIIVQIGETHQVAFFLIPITVLLVSTLVAKNTLIGFRT